MRNKYNIKGDNVTIILNGGKSTLISLEDLGRAKEMPFTWYAHQSPHGRKFYVVANIYEEDGTRKGVKLHRWLMNPLEDEVVDHINHDTLDNRRCNLRNVSAIFNFQNRETHNRNSSTGIRGVSYRKDTRKYRARIYHKRKVIYTDNFDTLHEAENAITTKRREIFGL